MIAIQRQSFKSVHFMNRENAFDTIWKNYEKGTRKTKFIYETTTLILVLTIQFTATRQTRSCRKEEEKNARKRKSARQCITILRTTVTKAILSSVHFSLHAMQLLIAERREENEKKTKTKTK